MLDLVLGGGWPLGRIVNVVGDKSTGKTLLAMEAVANFFQQYESGWCKYVDAEGAFDDEYARALGIPIDRVQRTDSFDTVEDLFEDLQKICKSDDTKPGLYIVDSLDGLSDEAEMGRSIREGSYGGTKPKKMGELFRKLCRRLRKKNICVIIISQVRDVIGVTFGNKQRRSGGKALDFYAAQVLWLAHIKRHARTIHKVERVYAVRIRAKCDKNKIDQPFRECEFDIRFGYGIEDKEASLNFLKEAGVPVKSSGITPSELDALVGHTWYEIEKRFLPAKRKYGDET